RCAGEHVAAVTVREPLAAGERTSEAGLELALLYRTIGRAADAQPLLTGILRQGGASSDPAVLLRAGRAARALNRPRDAKAFYNDAERAGGDGAMINTAWGWLLLEKYNNSEALKSFQAGIEAAPDWAPAYAGIASVLEDEDPPKAVAAAATALT